MTKPTPPKWVENKVDDQWEIIELYEELILAEGTYWFWMEGTSACFCPYDHEN